MDIGYHVWNWEVSEEYLRIFGFTKRDGFYDKMVESSMTKDYVKIFVSNS